MALWKTVGNEGCENLSGKTAEHGIENRDTIAANGTKLKTTMKS